MPETKVVSFAEDGSSFFDNLLDIVNPLQHIPVVSTIYRAISGDEIAAPARLIGGALFGGPMGLGSAAANLMFEEVSGDDLAGHALALIGDTVDAPELANAVAPAADAAAPVADLTALAAQPRAPQAATPAAATAAATSVSGPGPDPSPGPDIIWNGPRILPSLARSTATPPSAAPIDRSVNISAAQPAPISMSDGSPAERADLPAALPATSPTGLSTGSNKPDAAGANPAARPAWLDAAIADAQAVQGTAQKGAAPQKVDGQPWISDAMLEALGKYREMNLERNR
ncbi:MAG: hypothetical protein GKS02_08150 [Alphaproteobacteria bacterium]|nr:hypothetical protein [Alphaproteobacteria bacterium]